LHTTVPHTRIRRSVGAVWVMERATGRAVIGFMSGNQQHPDMMCEVFILAPTDLLGKHEWGDASGGSGLTA
jgi:hypothetical protein